MAYICPDFNSENEGNARGTFVARRRCVKLKEQRDVNNNELPGVA